MASPENIEPDRAVASAGLEPLAERLAQVIHDRVLQSLALGMLQADLCRRAIEAGNREQALAELNGIPPELEAAVLVLREVVRDLNAAAGVRRPTP
jgi:signal transduction histidine kinase